MTSPVARRPIHKRAVTFDVYEREDGLIDVECTVQDSKPFAYPDRDRGVIPPGGFIHDIACTLTADGEGLVNAVAVTMRDRPYDMCEGSTAAAQGLVGRSLTRGWRKALAEILGGTCGCTHLREMLGSAPTAFIQATTALRQMQRIARGEGQYEGEKPYWIGGCHTWAEGTPVTERFLAAHPRHRDDGHTRS
ncbi:DUF2889 domain-containing protein [uncultured Alsobacter sp.]|uniref:DUF2889 domain-containing protein n=1 Tax=uncultured Alsobacter sp. TaxID=1748258 RepID=UPI0025CD0D65|nr:DUF2889 domain-containing protein [uncultured Alsobacter sp.]